MAFYFSSVTKALYDTDVFPVASLPANKVEISEAAYAELMTKQNQGYVILADGSGNPYTVNQSEASATDIKHAASVATTVALGHVKIGNTMTAANDGTLDVKDDAITADKVKDNETLPVNVSGRSNYIRPFIIDKGAQTTNVWAKVATVSVSAWNGFAITLTAGFDGYAYASSYAAEIAVGYQVGSGGAYANRQFYIYRRRYSTDTLDAKLLRVGDTLELWIKNSITDTNLYLVPVYFKGFSVNYADSGDRSKQLTDSAFSDYIADKTKYDASVRTVAFIPGMSQVGSPSIPVYVDSDGQVKPCDASPFIIDKMVKEDGTDIDFLTSIPFNVGYDEGFKTIGKLNISPSNKNCIIDITFMMRDFQELDENDNSGEIPAATFAVFVGNTEISSFYLQGAISNLDANYSPYTSSPSFRCTFSANINNTIYIKVKKSSYYSRKLKLHGIQIQGLAFYKD